MLNYLYLDRDNIVQKISKDRISTNRYRVVRTEESFTIGDQYVEPIIPARPPGFRLAVICNWNDQCGISTYSKYLVDSLAGKVDALKIFGEINENVVSVNGESYDVEYIWQRGYSMVETIEAIKQWQPSAVLIQHEFGIFPKATHFLTMLDMLRDIPHLITIHSVYEHLDKSICTAQIKNMVVHSKTGEVCLRSLGNQNNITVIPHGCVTFEGVAENWNILQTPHAIMQFGFGFAYKGVDTALDAVRYLIDNYPNYEDIYYCYYSSENPHTRNINNGYYQYIQDKIDDLNLRKNVSVQRGYQTDDQLNQLLRTYKMAIFPYITQKDVVYGASGAARISMANNIPVVASHSHMFDDLDGVLPRPKDARELAETIRGIFDDWKIREDLLTKQRDYVINNTWDITADRYLKVLKEII